MERSSSPSEDSNEDISAVANYQEQKKKSILEFCKKDDRSFSPFPRSWDRDPPPIYGMLSSIPPDIWEGGKRDFAQGLYEQAEKASDQNIVPIIERDVLKIMWRVECLRRQKDNFVTLPITSTTHVLRKPTDAIPHYWSIVSNIKIIGIIPTEDWREDPEGRRLVPGFSDNYFYGFYRVVDFDLTVADGSIMKLNAVINVGDPANRNSIGLWGGIFLRDLGKKVATVSPYDDACWIEIVQVSSNLDSFAPFGESDLVYHYTLDIEDEIFFAEYDVDDIYYPFFYEGWCPGLCRTQFERIMGMVVRTIMDCELEDFPISEPWEGWQPQTVN